MSTIFPLWVAILFLLGYLFYKQRPVINVYVSSANNSFLIELGATFFLFFCSNYTHFFFFHAILIRLLDLELALIVM